MTPRTLIVVRDASVLIGVLLRARHSGRVPALKPVLDTLIQQHNFRLARTLYEQVLRQVGEHSEIETFHLPCSSWASIRTRSSTPSITFGGRRPEFTGRSIGRTVEIAIHNFTPTFGGRLRLHGSLECTLCREPITEAQFTGAESPG